MIQVPAPVRRNQHEVIIFARTFLKLNLVTFNSNLFTLFSLQLQSTIATVKLSIVDSHKNVKIGGINFSALLRGFALIESFT